MESFEKTTLVAPHHLLKAGGGAMAVIF